MKLTRILLKLFIFSYLAQSLFEDSEYITSSTPKEISREIETSDFTTIAIIYDSSSSISWNLSRTLKDLAEKFSAYTKFFVFDCLSDSTSCDQENLSYLPSLTAYVPGIYDFDTQKYSVYQNSYTGDISSKEIGEFIMNNIAYHGHFLDFSNFDEFLQEENNKVILFTNKNKVPVVFKGISSRFQGKLEFGVVWSNQTELVLKYSIQEYPTLVVASDKDIYRYTGKYEFKDISDYLVKFASSEKKLSKFSKKQPISEKNQKFPSFEIENLTFENFDIIKSQNSVVLAHFYKDKKLADWETIEKTYNGVVKLFTISCKTKKELEFCISLGVKKFPSLRLFPINKARKSFEVVYTNLFDLEEQVSKELKSEIHLLDQSFLPTFLSSLQTEQKLVCILIGGDTIPIQFKGLAANQNFTSFLKFVFLDIPYDNAIKYFNIETYPSLVSAFKINKEDNLQIVNYKESLSDYANLYYFIDQVSIPMFLEKQPKILEEDQDEVDQVYDETSFNNKCIKKGGVCALVFLKDIVRNM